MGEHRPNDESRFGDGQTWLESDRPAARATRPLQDFLHLEIAGGLVLLAATVAALVLANTPAGPSLANFWDTKLTFIETGGFRLSETLGHWVNDGLMAIFFFVVGLEIKRELVDGELRDRRRAALPAIAALGGIVVPAGIYLLFNGGGIGSRGWGIPIATDIAFAVGVMALLGSRVPAPAKVFLLTLAIVDDIGAILVIAVFYSDGIDWAWLAAAAAMVGLIVVMKRARIWSIPVYVVVGTGVWIATLESGVHATIAGVVLGLLTPAKPLRSSEPRVAIDDDSTWGHVRASMFDVRESRSVAERLQHAVHPWSAFVILPLFAFANAGIELSSDRISDAARSPVTAGIVLGLVVGKPVGVLGAAWLAERLGLGDRPPGVNWRHITGAGALAGIGFTVSLFVAGLAFDDAAITAETKIGVLVASVVAACIGAALFSVGHRRAESSPEAPP